MSSILGCREPILISEVCLPWPLAGDKVQAGFPSPAEDFTVMPCVDLDDAPSPKKQIACTRSFGRPITDLAPLIEAVSEFATRAAEKLRRQNSLASQVLVFSHTSQFRQGPRFSKSTVVPLRRPTAETAHLVHAAALGILQIYQPGFQLIKAGVMLLDLVDKSCEQWELDLEAEDLKDRTSLMQALDLLNGRYGKGTVHMCVFR